MLGVSLDSVPALRLGPGLVEPPFGTFTVLYCEGGLETNALESEMADMCDLEGLSGYGACASIRVIRTQQGTSEIVDCS